MAAHTVAFVVAVEAEAEAEAAQMARMGIGTVVGHPSLSPALSFVRAVGGYVAAQMAVVVLVVMRDMHRSDDRSIMAELASLSPS